MLGRHEKGWKKEGTGILLFFKVVMYILQNFQFHIMSKPSAFNLILYLAVYLLSLQVAVEVFGLVQQLLPSVAILNQKYAPPAFNPNQSTDSTTGNQPEQGLSACTTSNHYAVIECEHPYKPACITQYKVGITFDYVNLLRPSQKLLCAVLGSGAMQAVLGSDQMLWLLTS